VGYNIGNCPKILCSIEITSPRDLANATEKGKQTLQLFSIEKDVLCLPFLCCPLWAQGCTW